MQAPSSDDKAGSGTQVGRRLVGYVRVSTDEQAATGLSLDAQRVRIAACATAFDCDLVRVEEDHLSGRLGPNRREGLARALEAVRGKEADGLVVFKLDRLSRKTMDVLELADDARRQRWRLLSVCEHLDTSTAAGQFVLTMFAALAEMERRQIGERTALGMAQVARQGRARSYVLPFGYRVAGSPKSTVLRRGDKNPLVAEPREQAMLAEIMRLNREGLGGHAIATRFRTLGIRNPRTGKAWSASGLRSIIQTAEKRREIALVPATA